MKSQLFINSLLCAVLMFSSMELMGDRGGGYGGGYDRGTGGGYGGGYDRGGGYGGGSFDHGNNPYWTNHRYTDPSSYYGTTGVDTWYYGQVLGGATTPAQSSPGMSDDSDALYNSYLQSNPQRPY